MVSPLLLGLGAGGAGFLNALDQKRKQQQQQQNVQAYVAALQGRNPGGLGASPSMASGMGANASGTSTPGGGPTQGWGTGQGQSGTVNDPWGNAIGPQAAGTYGGGTPLAGMDPSSIGSGPNPIPTPTPAPMQAQPVAPTMTPNAAGMPGMAGGPSGGADPMAGVDPMSALFSGGGFGGFGGFGA